MSNRISSLFPKNNRFITEFTRKRVVNTLFVGVSVILGVLCIMKVIDIGSSMKLMHFASVREQETFNNYAYWQSVVERYPNYAGGAYQAAVHAYMLNKKAEGDRYMDDVLRIDPFFLERE